MVARTYVLSVHDEDGNAVLQEVRTGRDARLADLSDVGPQIERWAEQDRRHEGPGETARTEG